MASGETRPTRWQAPKAGQEKDGMRHFLDAKRAGGYNHAWSNGDAQPIKSAWRNPGGKTNKEVFL
jgi:hypothetical protein